MSRPEVVLCKGDLSTVLDLAIVSDVCPPILRRFLDIPHSNGMASLCFKAPARDDCGRLTFVKELDISRSSFQACITFLKTGYVDQYSFEGLVRTMDILGGSEKLDAYVAKKQVEIEAATIYRRGQQLSERTNPMTPEADIEQLYSWRAMHAGWSAGDEWSVTCRVVNSSPNTVVFWWRKLSGTP